MRIIACSVEIAGDNCLYQRGAWLYPVKEVMFWVIINTKNAKDNIIISLGGFERGEDGCVSFDWCWLEVDWFCELLAETLLGSCGIDWSCSIRVNLLLHKL